MTDQCGAPHHDYPQTLCAEPPGHYRRDRDPHAGPLIIDGRECGGAAWDEPKGSTMTDRRTADTITDQELAELYTDADRSEEAIGELNEHVINFQRRAERAELALTRVHHLADVIAAGAPWTANHDETAHRIREAATVPPAPTETQATSPGGPAVSCRPQPAGLVARWRDTVRTARQQTADQTTERGRGE